ncbi:MAG: cyclase/dehydrase [Betaproteobacteria bacterium]|nr:MAG: cyclase/dehydrase [Betaproteobacteria bacterium]
MVFTPRALLPALLLAAAVALPATAGAAEGHANLGSEPITASVQRIHRESGTVYEIHTSGFVQATPQQVWKVLTDYNRMHEFVPNLRLSRLLSRNGTEAVVEERGSLGFLFLTQDVRLVVKVLETPFSAIDITLVEGDMKQYSSHWEIAPATENGASGTRITYSGSMMPNFFVPPFLGTVLIRRDVKNMVDAVIAEIGKSS